MNKILYVATVLALFAAPVMADKMPTTCYTDKELLWTIEKMERLIEQLQQDLAEVEGDRTEMIRPQARPTDLK